MPILDLALSCVSVSGDTLEVGVTVFVVAVDPGVAVGIVVEIEDNEVANKSIVMGFIIM